MSFPNAGFSLDQTDATRLRILDAIRASTGIARKEIAEHAGTSPATVTAVTAGLLDAGLIEEVPVDAASGNGRRGRPRVMLRLRAGACHVAGIKVSRKAMSVLIVDFAGTERVAHDMALSASRMSRDGFVAAIRQAVAQACAKADLSETHLAGITIGLAGYIDSARKHVHWSSSLEQRNLDLEPFVENNLPYPVFLENDANLVAKAEQVYGEGRDVENFLVVTIEHGVGLGIILGGDLYTGVRGCGAEFGHMKVQLDGALCQCGQRGCLEAYVGDYALLREASLGDPANQPDTVADIMTRAMTGDRLSQTVLDRAGQMFALGMANLINLFDPQRIVLAGAQIQFEHLHTDRVMDRIRNSVTQVDAPLPDIRVHAWGDLMWARGAAAHAIEQVSIRHIKALKSRAA